MSPVRFELSPRMFVRLPRNVILYNSLLNIETYFSFLFHLVFFLYMDFLLSSSLVWIEDYFLLEEYKCLSLRISLDKCRHNSYNYVLTSYIYILNFLNNWPYSFTARLEYINLKFRGFFGLMYTERPQKKVTTINYILPIRNTHFHFWVCIEFYVSFMYHVQFIKSLIII